MSMAIIANPVSGRGRGVKIAEQTKQILLTKKIDFELLFTQYPGQAIDLAYNASTKHETIVALGGDGTIREVLEGAWQSESTLGIIPSGTGNDYARGLRIPRKTNAAIETLLANNSVPFDVCLKNKLVFGVLSSIGFPVDVIQHVNDNRQGFWKGQLAFLTSVISTVRHLKSYPVRITIDGQVFEKEVIGLFAMNMPYGGGGMMFTPGASYNDGVMRLLTIDTVSKLDLSITLPKVYFGKHTSHHAVSILAGKEIKVESDPLAIMLDGDVFPPLSFNAKIMPGATRIIVPKSPVA